MFSFYDNPRNASLRTYVRTERRVGGCKLGKFKNGSAVEHMKRVVITGMGAVTPIGNSVAEYWKNALE